MNATGTIRQRWWVQALVGTAAGGLIALSLPPFGWWPLGIGAFALVTLDLPQVRLRDRAILGWCLGLIQFGIGVYWVQEFSIPGYVGVVLISAVFTAVALMAVSTRRPWTIALSLPPALVLADWLRDRYPIGGFPLGGVSLGQAAGPLAPSLRLGGSLLLTGETVVCGVAAAHALHAGWRRRKARTPDSASTGPVWGSLLIALLAVAVPLAGWLSPSGSGGHLPLLRVALVQGGGPRGTRAIYTDPQVVFDRHLEASQDLRLPLDLVVWPEGVLQSHVSFTTTADAAEVASLARQTGATVLVGVEQDVGVRHYINEVVAWDSDGRIVASYQKNHLVPFGEYVPYRNFVERFVNIADVPYDAIPGHGPGFISTPAAPLGIMISYEVFFDSRARGAVRAGGQVLLVPTNTASYRSTQVPTQEVAADRLRAWETGRWVLQVTPTGYTSVTGPTGNITERSKLDSQQVLYASVPRETGRTIYVDIGDTPIALVAAVLLIGSVDMQRLRAQGSRRRS